MLLPGLCTVYGTSGTDMRCTAARFVREAASSYQRVARELGPSWVGTGCRLCAYANLVLTSGYDPTRKTRPRPRTGHRRGYLRQQRRGYNSAIAYALATKCPVLTWRSMPRSPLSAYAPSDTDEAYGPTRRGTSVPIRLG
eukprot:1352769-Rhodomonas_salina.2